jgi:hypothetical protein
MSKEFWREIEAGLIVGSRMDHQGLLWRYAKGVFIPGMVTRRNVYEDAKKYVEGMRIETTGIENLPKTDGALLVFNHPQGDIVFPGMFELIRVLGDEVGRKDFCIMMGGSMPMHNRMGDALYSLTDKIIARFADLFEDNVLKIPSRKSQSDYTATRQAAKDLTVEMIDVGKKVFALSPAGALDGYGKPRRGAGEIGRRVSETGRPVIPVAIWKGGKMVFLSIGKGFSASGLSDEDAAIKMVEKIRELIPENNLEPEVGSDQYCKKN